MAVMKIKDGLGNWVTIPAIQGPQGPEGHEGPQGELTYEDVYDMSELNTYSSNDTYLEGDYVYYNKLIYKCNTAILVAEEWTPAHWTQKTYLEYLRDSLVVEALEESY